MTLLELKERVDSIISRRGGDLEVCIPNHKGGMGGISVTNVKGAHNGIDWDSNKFIIYPEKEMVEMPESFNETKAKESSERFKQYEAYRKSRNTVIAQRLKLLLQENGTIEDFISKLESNDI